MEIFQIVQAKIDTLERKNPRLVQMGRYLLVGGSAATIELLLFLLLVQLGIWFLPANIIALATAGTYGFFLQKHWTFKNKQPEYGRQAVKYTIVVGIGFVLNNLLIYLFIHVFAWHPFWAKVAQLWLVLIWNYSGQRWFAFTHHSKTPLAERSKIS